MATHSQSSTIPRDDDPAPIVDETNRWYVEGQYDVYKDAKMLNEMGVITWLVKVERRVLTSSFHMVSEVHMLFNLHKFD